MKKFFSINLSLILTLQFIVFPVRQVEANDFGVKTPGMEGPSSDADLVNDAEYKVGNRSKGGYDFYVKQVLVLANSILGSNILPHCPQGLIVPSLAAYMGGSIAYIAHEIAAGKERKNIHKVKIKEIAMDESKLPTSGGEFQKLMLKEAREEEQRNLEFIRKKTKWMKAIMAIYWASVGLAIAEEIIGMTYATAQCLKSANVAMATCVAAGAAAKVALISSFRSNNLKAEAPVKCTGSAVVAPLCMDFVNNYLNMFIYPQCRTVGPRVMNFPLINALGMAWGIASGMTDGGNISRIGSMLIGLLTMIVPQLAQLLPPLYNLPLRRAVTFGVAASLSTVVYSGLKKREERLEENVKKLDAVLADFKLTEESTGVEEGESSAYPESDSSVPEVANGADIELLPEGAQARPTECLSEKEFSREACKAPLKVSMPNLKPFGDLSSITDVSALGAEMANAVASGNMAKADLLAGQIGNKALSVRQTVDKLQKKLNEKLKEQKQDPFDFDKEIKDQVASLHGTFDQAMNQKGFALSDFGPQIQDKKVEGKPKATASTPTEIKGASTVVSTPDATDWGLGTGLDENSDSSSSDNQQDISQKLADFEVLESDISKDKDVSIFKQLSNRYILNMPKIFSKKSEPSHDP